MMLSDLGTKPLASLDDKLLLALSRQWGRVGQVAMRRFLATLPEIARRGLYRRARCHSIHEYAARFAGASRELVDTVFLVHRRIGSFEVLWGLFSQGRYGLPAFRRISQHVTADNAAWWAEMIEASTLREIEMLLRERECAEDALPGQLPFAASVSAADAAAGVTALPSTESAVAASQVSAGEAACSGGDVAGDCCLDLAPTALGAAKADSLERPAPAGIGLTPLAAHIARNLIEAYQRRGLTVSRSEVIEAALKALALSGDLPEIGLAAEPAPTPGNASDEPQDAKATSATMQTGNRALRPVRQPRILITLAEVGMSFLRTIGGLVPLSLSQAAELSVGQPALPYRELLARAEAAGRKATGRAIPASVKLAVSLRAGGTCEAGACTNPLAEFDHLDPYVECRTHLPQCIAGLCSSCHRAHHAGLVQNPQDPPSEWRLIAVGTPRQSRPVDALVAQRRSLAKEAQLLPILAC